MTSADNRVGKIENVDVKTQFKEYLSDFTYFLYKKRKHNSWYVFARRFISKTDLDYNEGRLIFRWKFALRLIPLAK